MERGRDRDHSYIQQQDREIQKLQDKIKRMQTAGVAEKVDNEKEQLKASLDRIIEVKLKYENIIKALVEKPEIKPIIASILENM